MGSISSQEGKPMDSMARDSIHHRIAPFDKPVGLQEKKARLHLRKVVFDPTIGLHKLTVGDDSDSQRKVYRQVDITEVKEIVGNLEAIQS